jgi:phage shock protein C
MRNSAFDRLRSRFHLDRRNGWIGGVCAGVADTLRTDPAFLRVGFVVAGLFLPKVTIAVYLIAWILLDERSATPRQR